MKIIKIAFLISISIFLFSCGKQKWDENTKPIRLEFKLVKDAADKNNLILEDKVLLRNEDISDALASSDQYKKAIIILTFTKDGAESFKTIATNNTMKQLAILLDGKIVSAPIITGPAGIVHISIPEITPDKAKEIVAGILKYKDNSSK